MEEKTINLPDLETLRSRLQAINNHSHLEENFHRTFLREAGKKKSLPQICQLYIRAYNIYTSAEKGGVTRTIRVFPFIHLDEYLEAMVADEVLRAQLKDCINNLWTF